MPETIPEQTPTTFFSYSREDSEFVLGLAKELRAAGAKIWLDQLDIGPGQHWDRSVEEALRECSLQVVILSPASVKSENVMDEVSYALDRGKQVIPVLFRDCEVPLRIRRLEYIDFRSDRDAGLKALLQTLGKVKAASATPASGAGPSSQRADVAGTRRPAESTAKKGLTGRKWMIAGGIVLVISLALGLGLRFMMAGQKPRVVSASGDGTLKVWDMESGRELHTLRGHLDKVWGVALSGDGRLAVSVSADKTLKVWDVDRGKEVRTLQGHSAAVYRIAMSTDGRTAVSTSADKTLKIWDIQSGRELRSLQSGSTVNGLPLQVGAVAVTANGEHAICAYSDDTLGVWDLGSGSEVRLLVGHRGVINDVAVSADGRRAVSASSDKTVRVWDVERGGALLTLAGHSDEVFGVALSADGRTVVSASKDNTLKVWDALSGRELHTLTGHSGPVTVVALTADGRTAVSGSSDRTLKVWDIQIGRELHTLAGHSGTILGVAVNGADR